MNGLCFFRIVDAAFAPFLSELGFEVEAPSLTGRMYRARFVSKTHSIDLSFEPGEGVLFVMVLTKECGKLSDIDDRAKTPRLSDLNSRFMHEIDGDERSTNENFFRSIAVQGNDERKLLKAAKELRLVLPRYLRRSLRGNP
jgi:hypothetical protein